MPVKASWMHDPEIVAGADALKQAGKSNAEIHAWLEAQGIVAGPMYRVRSRIPERGISGKYLGGVTSTLDTTGLPYDTGPQRTAPDGHAEISDFTSDKKISSFSWRRANPVLRDMQALKHEASGSQDYATIDFSHATEPICILALSDGHFGSIGCDYETLERVTDEILSIPNLYVAVLGDMLEMAVKLRSVLEVSGNLLSPQMQLMYLESWLDEIAHKVVFACWDNHSSERLEKQAGNDAYGELFKRRTIFHSGIGHPDVIVGTQTYRFAVSHVFRGRSMYNVTHSQSRYLRMEAPERDICMAGDSHVPGLAQYTEGGRIRTVINGGTGQVNSGYGRRYFSLKSWPTWPCVLLDPREHRVTPFWSVSSWLASRG